MQARRTAPVEVRAGLIVEDKSGARKMPTRADNGAAPVFPAIPPTPARRPALAGSRGGSV
jgi:hypothetical protein